MDERKWLFTDSDLDLRGNLAAKVLINSPDASNWMNAVNFERSSIQGDERDKDVHHEIVDFVVDTALFHRQLDQGDLSTNASQQKVYEKTFGRWNSLSDDSKAFYRQYLNLMKRNPATGAWQNVDSEADYPRAATDKSNFRLNLKKDAMGGGETEIGKALPKIDTTKSNRIFYTAAGGVQSIAATPDFLRRVHDAVYSGLALPVAGIFTGKSAHTRFSINVDNLVKNRMFAITQAEVVEAEEPELAEDEAFVNLVGRDVIKRDHSGLYVEVDGTKAYLGANDDKTKELLRSAHKCYSTGTKGSDAACKKFIFECLLSQDAASLDSCLKGLKSATDFFKVAVEDIKNIHPVLALRILQQFGFRKYQSADNAAGMQLWKVESVSHWLENYMTKKFKAVDVQNMIKADDQYHLLSYLRLLTQYVNANPAILNKHYSGTSDEALGKLEVSPLGRALGLSFEVPRDLSDRARVDYGRLASNLKLVRASRMPVFVSGTGRRFLTTPWGSSMTPGVSLLVQRGGSNCEQQAIYIQKNSGSALLKQFFTSALKNLEAHGKHLNAKDLEKINMHLKKNEEIERELIKTYCYLDEYNHLMDVLGDYNSKRLNMDDLKRIVNRQEVLLSKQGVSEDQIMQIFSKLLDVFGDESKDMVPVKAADALAN